MFFDVMADMEPATPIALTARQKIALMLDKAKYPHAEIARRMGMKNRETASRLLARARRAEKAMRENAIELLGV